MLVFLSLSLSSPLLDRSRSRCSDLPVNVLQIRTMLQMHFRNKYTDEKMPLWVKRIRWYFAISVISKTLKNLREKKSATIYCLEITRIKGRRCFKTVKQIFVIGLLVATSPSRFTFWDKSDAKKWLRNKNANEEIILKRNTWSVRNDLNNYGNLGIRIPMLDSINTRGHVIRILEVNAICY